MSQADQEKDASMDKKEIAEEEREKMLNEENTKHTGAAPTPDLESEEQKPKKKIPIGGIKMPGFCRTKSKEPCKEDSTKPTETGGDNEGTEVGTKDENASEKPVTPSKDAKEKEGRRGILNAIRLPLTSVFPKKKTKAETDAELGATAGLASVETLGDGGEKGDTIGGEDGMETVRLDGGDDQGPPKNQHPIYEWIAAAKRNRLVTAAVIGFLLIVTIIIAVACSGPRGFYPRPPRAGKYVETTTSCGPVEGVIEDGGVAFRGIPYAVPPVNNFRWKNAETLHRIEYCWNGTFLAYNSSSPCWQRDSTGRIEGSEDCLYLDVFTPEVSYHSPLPVVVMIGAETLEGASPGVLQPSTKLARVRDMVFVRPNFRLGVFGFLAAEPITRTSYPKSSGNYGLSDIIAVLKWVQLNIQHFGGDRDSVTVWGHRAGGTLVSTLLSTRAAREYLTVRNGKEHKKALFSRAWISSPSILYPSRPLNTSEISAEIFLDAIQCRDVTCLRSKSAENVMDSVPRSWYHGDYGLPEPREASINTDPRTHHEWIVIDGQMVREDVLKVLHRDGPPVKVVMGTTAHSAIPLRFKDSNITLETTQVERMVKESLLGTKGIAEEALGRYNATLSGLVSMISDIRVVCPILNLTTSLRTNDRDLPFYLSTQGRTGQLVDANSDVAAILGSYTAKTPEEKRHVSAIQQLFNQFVWHGRVIEAANKPANRNVIVVDQDILPQSDHANCEFWMKKNIVPTYARLD